MNAYEIIFIILSVTVSNVAVFFISEKSKNGANKKDVNTINPVKYIKQKSKEKQFQEEKAKEEKYMEVNLYNIEHYTGDSTGQKDFEE